jgi:hypothetical protein
MADEKVGIKEFKEALIGAQELSILIIKNLKDGLQIGQDVAAVVTALLSDEALKAALSSAADGISKVPSELKDIDLAEVIELVSLEVAYVPKIIEALKK